MGTGCGSSPGRLSGLRSVAGRPSFPRNWCGSSTPTATRTVPGSSRNCWTRRPTAPIRAGCRKSMSAPMSRSPTIRPSTWKRVSRSWPGYTRPPPAGGRRPSWPNGVRPTPPDTGWCWTGKEAWDCGSGTAGTTRRRFPPGSPCTPAPGTSQSPPTIRKPKRPLCARPRPWNGRRNTTPSPSATTPTYARRSTNLPC